MAKTYIAKESTSQEILSAVRSITAGGAGAATIGTTAMGDVVNANATLVSQTSVNLTWEDPIDNIVAGSKISDWLGTKVVRKQGSIPQDETDGTVVVDTSVRNQYKNAPFTDTGLANGVTYYYRWFPYNVYNIHTPGTAKSVLTDYETPTIYVTKTALGLYPTHMEESLLLYNYTDGEITVKTSNPNIIATLTDSGVCKTLTVTASYIVEGDYTVTLVQQGNGVFNGYGELVIPVTLTEDVNNLTNPEINAVSTDVAPELWQQLVNDGVASTFFDVGDSVPIELNGDLIEADGTTVKKSFDHETYYLTILGFDHNKDLETNGKNSIHFILGKNEDGVDIAFNGFRINTGHTNSGGWKSSGMRTNTCPSFFNCLPPRWQLLVKETTKYSDNTGGDDGSLSNTSLVTATQDKVFLLAEYEVQGARTSANTGEASKQAQYDYYKNGNSKIRYNADNPTSAIAWGLRSSAGYQDYDNDDNPLYYHYFCFVIGQHHIEGRGPTSSAYAFAPGFSLIAES